MNIYIYIYLYLYLYIYTHIIHNIYIERDYNHTHASLAVPSATSIYIYICLFVFLGGVKPAQIQVTSSFISLGLVYPLPQPLISNRPWQCRSSAKGRHPVLKRYLGEGTQLNKVQSFANSILWTGRAVLSNTGTDSTLSIPGPRGPLPHLLREI